jgi:predicted nucleic acid-binding protein
VLAELDYLLARHVGSQAQSALLEEIARGAYRLEPFGAADVKAAGEVIDRYVNLRIGLADASLVVLAARHGCRDVLTLDERHFRALRIGRRKRFRLLPADH